MRIFLESFIVCFSMYSALPMPHIQWNDKNMRYAFCFFPFVGVLIGGMVSLCLYLIQSYTSLSPLFSGMLLTVLPTLVTGGIHLDGYIDTCDAVFSGGDKEKKLEVLADPQAGAFGVIYSILYIIVFFTVSTEIAFSANTHIFFLIFPFIISRCIGGIQSVFWKSAKESGLKYLFAEGSSKKPVLFSLSMWIIFFIVLGFIILPMLMTILLLWLVLLLLFLRNYFYKDFGGITGDLIGFTISITELSTLLITMIYMNVVGL